jgi:hypothetical protein
MGGQRQASAALPSGKGPGTHCTGVWLAPRVRKISPRPEFYPRTVQPIASGYTDWALSAHTNLNVAVWNPEEMHLLPFKDSVNFKTFMEIRANRSGHAA